MANDLPLTERQEQALACIRDHLARHGRTPTIREICRAMGVSSTSVALYYVRRLTEAGRIARDFNVSRGIVLADAITVFIGDEVLVEVDGELVRGRVVEPVAKAA